MSTTELAVSGPPEAQTDLPELAAWSRSLVITTGEECRSAVLRLQMVKATQKAIEDWFRPLKQKAAAAHKEIVSREKAVLNDLSVAEERAKAAILVYQQAEYQKAETERRRLQAIADEAARREREKAEQEVARQRAIENESRSRADDARRKAEEADAAERKKLLAQAAADERKASAASTKAETQEQRAEVAVAPVIHVAPAAFGAAGASTRTTWGFEIVDRKALIEFAVASGRLDLVTVNEKALAAYAKSMREGASMPGVRFFPTETLVVRAT